jgi:dynein heavy chain
MFKELKRQYYVTPTNYIELVKGYNLLLDEKKKELGYEITKLTNGLEKLREAAETSEALSKELSVSQLELNRKAKDCEDLMIRLETDNREAQDKSKEVELRSAAVAKESADIKSLEADA